MSSTVIPDIVENMEIVCIMNCEDSSVRVMDSVTFNNRSRYIANHVEVNWISSDNFRLTSSLEFSKSNPSTGLRTMKHNMSTVLGNFRGRITFKDYVSTE
jgi:hypothetical protein